VPQLLYYQVLIYLSMIMQRLRIDVCSSAIQTTPRFFSSLGGCITNRAIASAVRSVPLSIWRNQSALVSNIHIPYTAAHVLTRGRPIGCTELVPSGTMLHVTAKIPQGVRGVSASRIPRRPQPDILVLNWRFVLPNQPVPRCT
jgi:hypothetical protein